MYGGQIEATLSLGLRPMRVITAVVLPQALRAVVQPLPVSLVVALLYCLVNHAISRASKRLGGPMH